MPGIADGDRTVRKLSHLDAASAGIADPALAPGRSDQLISRDAVVEPHRSACFLNRREWAPKRPGRTARVSRSPHDVPDRANANANEHANSLHLLCTEVSCPGRRPDRARGPHGKHAASVISNSSCPTTRTDPDYPACSSCSLYAGLVWLLVRGSCERGPPPVCKRSGTTRVCGVADGARFIPENTICSSRAARKLPARTW